MNGLVATSDRLLIRFADEQDAPFIRALLTEPGFIENIGDRNIRNDEDARAYIGKFIASYQAHGHGLNIVERRSDGVPVGICGLLKRDIIDNPDLGYAFLAAHCGQGYATEAGAAVLQAAENRFAYRQIVAFTRPGNLASGKVLLKLGFRDTGIVRLEGYPEDSRFFIRPAAAAGRYP